MDTDKEIGKIHNQWYEYMVGGSADLLSRVQLLGPYVYSLPDSSVHGVS